MSKLVRARSQAVKHPVVLDDKGLIEMLTNHIDYFKARPGDLPKLTILLDNGY